MAKTIYLGIGLPGSGKTKYLKGFAAKHGYAYFSKASMQDIMPSGSTYQIIWQEINHQIDKELGQDRAVVVDIANTNKTQRRRIVHQYSSRNARIVGIWLDTPLTQCLANLKHKKSPIPKKMLLKMKVELDRDPPCEADGFDTVIRVTEPKTFTGE